MRHRAKCCQCPWEAKAETPQLLSVAAMRHQTMAGHTRIKIEEKSDG